MNFNNFDSKVVSIEHNGIEDKNFTKNKIKILSTNKYQNTNTPVALGSQNKSESKSINFNKTLNLKLNVSKIQPKYSSYYMNNDKEKNKQPSIPSLFNGMEPSAELSTQKFNTIDTNTELSNKNDITHKYGLTAKNEEFRINNKGKSFNNQNLSQTSNKENFLTVKNERSNSMNLNNNILSFNLNNYKVKNNEMFYMTKYNPHNKYKTIDDTKNGTSTNYKQNRSNSNSLSSRFEKQIVGFNFDKYNYLNSLTSKKNYGIVSAFSYNTHNGTSRDYNEDRVSIHLHVKNPNLSKENSKNGIKDDSWPIIHFISVIDGHGGSKCADYIKDNLVREIVKSSKFPLNIYESIKEGVMNIEKEFISKIAVGTHGNVIADYSGSCLVFFLSINSDIYIVNLGDSRAILFRKKGNVTEPITIDHKPDNNIELKRINAFGGQTFV
jgi:hypothetical protein